MITVVSGWIEARWNSEKWTRYYHDWRPSNSLQPIKYRAVIGVFQLEAHNTKTPVWRLVSRQNGMTYANRTGADIDLDCHKKAAQASFILLTSDYPWVDGLHPNKALDKGDVVSLFSECAKMPRPIALDYARDRA